jgi:hypothetical protein
MKSLKVCLDIIYITLMPAKFARRLINAAIDDWSFELKEI